jgi:hypothetical protein
MTRPSAQPPSSSRPPSSASSKPPAGGSGRPPKGDSRHPPKGDAVARKKALRRSLLVAAVAALVGLLWWGPWRAGERAAGTAPHAHDAGVTTAPLAAVSGLHGPRVLEGAVEDDRGEPVPGALLRVGSLAAPGVPPREVHTDAAGKFKLDDLPVDPLSLEVTCAGHEGKEHVAHAQESEPLTFVLARQGELQVALRDSPGQPVDGAEIVITGPGIWPAQAGRADGTGELIFKGLPAGDYRVRARRNARIALPAEVVSVIPGKRTETQLTLVEGAELRGLVVDQQSHKPLPRAQVSIQDLTPGIDAFEVRTDARGEFTARGLWPGAVRVDAQQEGYAAASRDLVLPASGRVELSLAGAASIAGVIVDEAGKPVGGARLSVSTDEGLPLELASERSKLDGGVGELGVTSGAVPALPIFESTEFALGTLATESDAQGGFRIARLAPVALALHVARAGYVAERVLVDELKPHEDRSALRVVLREAGRVVGRVVDARGRALSGVYVAARSGEREQSAMTNGAGEYTLRDLLGDVVVEAQPDGHSTLRCSVRVEARAEARCDLTADTAVHALTVRVVDGYGIGIEGALVSVTASALPEAGIARAPATQLTRHDGTLVLRELPAPPYLLDVRLGGYLSVTDLPVADGEHEVRVHLARAATLSGFVVDALGRAVPGAFVSTEEGEASIDTDAAGGFLLDGVPPGTHSLVGHHARAGEGRSSEVRARPSERLDGVRIVLGGRYLPGEDDAGARVAREDRPAKLEYMLEQRGRVLVVTQVVTGTPAARAGLRVGDVVSAIDGEPPLSAAHARGLLRDPSGRTALVRVLRAKRPVNLRYRRPAL